MDRALVSARASLARGLAMHVADVAATLVVLSELGQPTR
jgi:hypothetical protein